MTSATVPSWINKGISAPFPSWLIPHVEGGREPNGSFLIRSRHGQQRVHAQAIVFEHAGIAYTCPAGEAASYFADLQNEHAPTPAPVTRRAAPVESAPADEASAEERLPKAKAKLAKPKGMPPSIEMRHPGELKIDDSYQRSTDTGPSRALIKKIATSWDWRMCLPLVVSKRDDGFYVIDGQHRHAAANVRGDIPYLPCCVFVFENVAAEAAMFVALNRTRRPINRLDDFHAARASGDADALAVAALIEGAGFTVSRRTGSNTWEPGEVAFTRAIEIVRTRDGEDVAKQALGIMAEAFAGQRLVVGSPVFTVIAGFLTDRKRQVDRDRLLRAARHFDMRGWADLIAECEGGKERQRHLRDFFRMTYDEAEVRS